jgi:hypothetical protein
MHSRPPSYSQPGYTTLLTGAWPDINDAPPLNLEYADLRTWTQDDLFSSARRAGLKTAISAYYWFEKFIPREAVSASFYTNGDEQHADSHVIEAVLPWLTQDYAFLLIHFDQVDYAGHHEGGPGDPRWNAAANRVDALVGEIASQLDFDQDTLFVTSDHGHVDRGGHGGDDAVALTEPFLLVGKGVIPGKYPPVAMVDVAPTLAALLGASLPASSQGRVLSEMLDLPEEQLRIIQQATLAGQTRLFAAYQAAIGDAPQPDPQAMALDPRSATQAAMADAREARLNRERLPRLAIALILLGVPLIGMLRWRKRDLPWQFLGGLIYILVFNLTYAVLLGRTYSLSSLTGALDFMGGVGLSVLLGILPGWLLILNARKILQRSTIEAAQAVLEFGLVVLYLLAFPMMAQYVWNGALVGWTLPHFPVMFHGFLAMIQVLFVSLIGPLLAGLTGLSMILRQRRTSGKASISLPG